MVKWCDIELLHNVFRRFQKREKATGVKPPVVVYQAKVKLHGANAGVQLYSDGTVFAQGRTRCLTPNDDDRGFAEWVQSRLGFSIRYNFLNNNKCTVFGEWCGAGMQRGSASQIPIETFAIFAVRVGDEVVFDPDSIEMIVSVESEEVKIIPWIRSVFLINWGDRESIAVAARLINELVLRVEECDPWVRGEYGIEGIGEGVVFYPLGITQWDNFKHLVFKAKGEKHKGFKAKKAVYIDPEVLKNIDDFIEMFMVESRFEQGLDEACDGRFDAELLSSFIAWVSRDVLKESEAEREVSNLDWKQVARAVNRLAAQWYMIGIKAGVI